MSQAETLPQTDSRCEADCTSKNKIAFLVSCKAQQPGLVEVMSMNQSEEGSNSKRMKGGKERLNSTC